ncbi:MAG: hypothetical protein ACSHX8_00150 [Opitutaceae bacterium]
MKLISKLLLATVCASLFFSLGCRKDKDSENLKVPRLMLETRGVNYGSPTGDEAILPKTGTRISLEKDPVVNEFEIINVELVKVDLGLALMIQVSEAGGRSLYRASVTNNGSRIVLLINGNAVGARRLDGAISDGKLYTFVELPDEELPQLVMDMKETIIKLQSDK